MKQFINNQTKTMKTLMVLIVMTITLAQAQAYILTPWFISIIQEVDIVTDWNCNWHPAYYSESKELIALCVVTLRNLTHEVGHRVWYRCMSKKERRIWTKSNMTKDQFNKLIEYIDSRWKLFTEYHMNMDKKWDMKPYPVNESIKKFINNL